MKVDFKSTHFKSTDLESVVKPRLINICLCCILLFGCTQKSQAFLFCSASFGCALIGTFVVAPLLTGIGLGVCSSWGLKNLLSSQEPEDIECETAACIKKIKTKYAPVLDLENYSGCDCKHCYFQALKEECKLAKGFSSYRSSLNRSIKELKKMMSAVDCVEKNIKSLTNSYSRFVCNRMTELSYSCAQYIDSLNQVRNDLYLIKQNT